MPEPTFHTKLVESTETQPDVIATIDLERQTISLPDGSSSSFPVDSFSKTCLLNDVDELGYLLRFQPQIQAYEIGRQAS
jgi:3-isopropylmalate/(R)-2-methylmalate dehydratase small subunit